MLDAVGRLVNDGFVCCSFSDLIVGKHPSDTNGQSDGVDPDDDVDDNFYEDGLNRNQVKALESSENQLALIWGPPGNIKIPLQNLTNLKLTHRHWENNRGRKNSAKTLQSSG